MSRQLYISYKRVWGKITHFFPYKMSHHQQLFVTDTDHPISFELTFLGRGAVDDHWNGISLLSQLNGEHPELLENPRVSTTRPLHLS
ncbi:hypothetical protein TNCT_407781 [Trichonephila clavata]|uniref:Uncharacterized protein n=1 Tax=Trichonephila clavata TaxID=2740835 RepID=A0A8X6KLD5_TRICU|nr:hypothetical protein TNCT_407781 [Trichonephila clavata]